MGRKTRREDLITRDELLEWVDLILSHVRRQVPEDEKFEPIVAVMDHLVQAELDHHGDHP